MFSFQFPWLILLLPLPLLIWLLPPKPAAKTVTLPQLRFVALARLQQAFAPLAEQQKLPTSLWQWLLLSLCWLGLVFAIMYPQWLDKHIEVTQSGYDLMLAVDISGSMDNPDFLTPNRQRLARLEAVNRVLPPFIANREGDRVGLIFFAVQAYLQAPLTLDIQAIGQLFSRTAEGMLGQRSPLRERTAIGDAIGLAVKTLRERPSESRVLILLTDGDNNSGTLNPEQAAQLAAEYEIQIYTIGVGSSQRGLDEALLQRIANMTDGQYFNATHLNALAEVYQRINNTLQKTEVETRVYLQRTPLYHVPLGVAMLALLGLWWVKILSVNTLFSRQ